MAHLYPINLRLEGRKCLMIGGGAVAERKAATLMEYEADIHIISPMVTDQIRAWAAERKVLWQPEVFQSHHLQGAYLVFIATDDQVQNKTIAALCRQEGILVNAVDDPPNCDFFVPSILRRGSLSVAVSTEGQSPLLAAKLRRELEKTIDLEYEEWVEILGVVRERLKQVEPDIEVRKKILAAIVYSDLLDLLIQEGREKVEERIEQCISSLRE